MNAPNTAVATHEGVPVRRGRLLRDRTPAEAFGLRTGEMYRIAYSAGGVRGRRVSRSVVLFQGPSHRRRWDGVTVDCLEFALPQGRGLSLLGSQLVDVRAAGQNERGQWVVRDLALSAHRRRVSRRAPFELRSDAGVGQEGRGDAQVGKREVGGAAGLPLG